MCFFNENLRMNDTPNICENRNCTNLTRMGKKHTYRKFCSPKCAKEETACRQNDVHTIIKTRLAESGENKCHECGKVTAYVERSKSFTKYCSPLCKNRHVFLKSSVERGITHNEKKESLLALGAGRCQCGKTTKYSEIKKNFLKYCSDKCRKKYVSEKSANTRIRQRNAEWYGSDVCDLDGCENVVQKKKTGQYSKYCSVNCRRKGVQQSLQQTVKEKYGVDNVFQLESVKQKSRGTSRDRYGVEYGAQSPVIKSRMQEHYRKKRDDVWYRRMQSVIGQFDINDLECKFKELSKNRTIKELADLLEISPKVALNGLYRFNVREYRETRSAFESDIMEFLKTTGAIFKCNTRKNIPPLELDFFIPEHNLAIECNGVYWHSELSGNKDKHYHLKKTLLCEEKGLRLIHITDVDWEIKSDIVKSMITSALGMSKKLYARKTVIVEVGPTEEQEFLDKNHIQGYVRSSVAYGLRYNGRLVSLMSFGKSRYNKTHIELLRFCNILDYTVVGAAGRLFNYYVRNTGVNEIISYSHKDKFTGNLYTQLGFEYSHSSSPAYYYTRDYINLENRIKYQKHKLSKLLENFDSSLTEWENMQNNDYDRMWDCGNSVWIWKRR